MNPAIKQLLDQKVKQYNHIDFIEKDPISIPHLYTKQQDIEIAAFFAATLSKKIQLVYHIYIQSSKTLKLLLFLLPFLLGAIVPRSFKRARNCWKEWTMHLLNIVPNTK